MGARSMELGGFQPLLYLLWSCLLEGFEAVQEVFLVWLGSELGIEPNGLCLKKPLRSTEGPEESKVAVAIADVGLLRALLFWCFGGGLACVVFLGLYYVFNVFLWVSFGFFWFLCLVARCLCSVLAVATLALELLLRNSKKKAESHSKHV